MIDDPKWETTCCLASRVLPEGDVVYFVQFFGRFDSTILGMAGPCQPVAAFELSGNEASPMSVPIFDCYVP